MWGSIHGARNVYSVWGNCTGLFWDHPVNALVDKICDEFVVLGGEGGEVEGLLQHSGVLGVGLVPSHEAEAMVMV